MQRIDMFKWLTEVLQYLGGTPHQVVTTERQQFKQMTISFEVPVRQDLGTIIPIVASGKESPVQMTYERSAIEACLLGLEIYVYLIPDLLEFKIKALRQNQHDIVSLCESLSRENLHAIDIFGNTLMAMSLEEILCQAVEQLGYYSTEGGTTYTREGLY
ncbi:hypothetical protein PVAP13_3NG269700 [Panicum virgatum]|uniref:Uncharacterized protein n=1 Tax=Panicum virgatum TaxID=38727 RepID=A0A8T0UPU1_PANVG|nr:hypothetical protein PVAP13_3NG269700 [Panicum virgatum]